MQSDLTIIEEEIRTVIQQLWPEVTPLSLLARPVTRERKSSLCYVVAFDIADKLRRVPQSIAEEIVRQYRGGCSMAAVNGYLHIAEEGGTFRRPVDRGTLQLVVPPLGEYPSIFHQIRTVALALLHAHIARCSGFSSVSLMMGSDEYSASEAQLLAIWCEAQKDSPQQKVLRTFGKRSDLASKLKGSDWVVCYTTSMHLGLRSQRMVRDRYIQDRSTVSIVCPSDAWTMSEENMLPTLGNSLPQQWNQLLSLLWYLSSSVERNALDFAVPDLAELENLRWAWASVHVRLQGILHQSKISKQQFTLEMLRSPMDEISSRSSFLPFMEQFACAEGEIFSLIDYYSEFLSLLTRAMNTPLLRQRCSCEGISSLEHNLLSQALGILEERCALIVGR